MKKLTLIAIACMIIVSCNKQSAVIIPIAQPDTQVSQLVIETIAQRPSLLEVSVNDTVYDTLHCFSKQKTYMEYYGSIESLRFANIDTANEVYVSAIRNGEINVVRDWYMIRDTVVQYLGNARFIIQCNGAINFATPEIMQ